MTQSQDFQRHCAEGRTLFLVKNSQYGNAFEKYGLLGVVCELLGAVARLPQLVLWSNDHGKDNKDALMDVLIDVHNYANMALMCISKDNWDGRSLPENVPVAEKDQK